MKKKDHLPHAASDAFFLIQDAGNSFIFCYCEEALLVHVQQHQRLLQSCFLPSCPLAFTAAGVYSSSRTELCTAPRGIFVSSAYLLRVRWVQVINGEVKQHWSSLYPWATAPMPTFWLDSALPIPVPGILPFIQACSLLPSPAWPVLHTLVWGCWGHDVVPATQSSSQRKVSGWSDLFPLY